MALDTRAQVWAKTQGRCWYCGKQTNPWDDFSVDHMDPRKQGGGDEVENLVPCCRTCNSRKHARTVEEFRVYIQGKAEHRFWFEHADIVPAPAREMPTESDTCEFCEAIEVSMNNVMYWSFFSDARLNLILLTIAYVEPLHPITLKDIAHFTNQDLDVVLPCLIQLIETKVVTPHWNNAEKEYWYSINDLEKMQNGTT